MSKSYLVIDTPDNCDSCPMCNMNLFDMSKRDVYCQLNKSKNISWESAKIEKPDWCPLKEKKEKKIKGDGENKTVDYGKIVALYQAGWFQKKIADEMGVSANAICVSLKRYKEKLEDGYAWDPEERKFIKKV